MILWYLVLFPGRLGYDGAEAIRAIQNHESTNNWTSAYFLFLKATSFNGKTIAITSLIGSLIFLYSVELLIQTLHKHSISIKKYRFLIYINPIFGFSAVLVSHDVFLYSTVFLVSVVYLKKSSKIESDGKLLRLVLIFSASMSFIGILLILISTIGLLTQRHFKLSFVYFMVIITVYIFTNPLVNQTTNNREVYQVLSDIKCVTQVPSARISDEDWQSLLKIASKNEWTNPLSCSDNQIIDPIAKKYSSSHLNRSELIKIYFKLAAANAPIVVGAHIQKSRNALPPPFFPRPDNMVDFDSKRALGLDSNLMLQSGPEVLHPSIDEISVSSRPSILRPIEYLAILTSFLINISSWFWGWGGLWIYPVLLFAAISKEILSIRWILPTLFLHLLIFLIGPLSIPRYTLSTVMLGLILIPVVLERVFKTILDISKS